MNIQHWKLDRWIALIILLICLVYGYTAFFTMDAKLPPFMKFNPIWPSTFPKILSVLGIICALFIVLGIEQDPTEQRSMDIDYTRLFEYKLGQAVGLLVIMALYAVLLRPLGFISATVLFLVLGSFILGERKFHIMIPVSGIATVGVWALVDSVLGIYLSPLPTFIGG